MPQWDRFWPFGLLAALAFLAASGSLAVWYLASLVGLPQQAGLPPLTDLGEMGGDVIWICGPGGLALLGWSRSARQRTSARRKALDGDEGAIRRASIVPDAADVPAESVLPLEQVWRRKPRGREWVALFIFTLFFGSVAALAIAAVVMFGVSPQDLARSLLQGPIGDLFASALLAAFYLSATVAGFIALTLALTSRLGPPYGVVADQHGIRQLHLKGPGPLLRWPDVRLIEIFQFTGDAQRVFTVYGTNSSVYWEDYTKARRKARRVRVDPTQFEERQRELLAVIATHTGRELRTFSPALMRAEDVSSVPVRKYRLLAYGFGYGVAGVLLALAVAVLALPLTHNALLDGYSAATCAAAGAGVGVFVRSALKPHTRTIGDEVQFTLPVAPLLGAEAIAVSYRRTVQSRLRDAAIGFPLVLDLVPAFAGIGSATYSPTSPLAAFATRVVASLVFLVAMVGTVAILFALQPDRTTLTLDVDGLSERSGRKMVRFPWREIVGVTVALEKDRPEFFTVLGREGETIGLPVRNIVWRALAPGQQSVTPKELAALVVARSGAELLVKDL